MPDFNYLSWIFVFTTTLGMELLWVFYIRRTTQGKAFQAAAFNVTIILLSALITISYVENKMLLIPIAAGGFVGTFVSIKIDRSQKGKKKRH